MSQPNFNEDSEDDVTPAHPGSFMKAWFMDGPNRSVEEVASAADLPAKIIQDIIDGSVDVDEPIARKLTRAFGQSAETLYRMQAEYNHFKVTGKILPFDKLPVLGY